MSKITSNEKTATKKSKRKNGEGSIYWDNHHNRYVAAYTDMNGKRQRKLFTNVDDAQAWRSAQKTAREKGENTYVRDPKSTLSEFLAEWLTQKTELSSNGYKSYEETIRNRINPYIGHILLKNLNAKILENFFKALTIDKEYKAGTVLGVRRTLSSAFNAGVRWGELPYNPLVKAKLHMPKKSVPSPQIPSEDVEKLRKEAAKNPYDQARIEIGIAPGLRPGEVAGLKWKDLDEAKQNLSIVRQIQRVRGKGLVESSPKSPRLAPLPLRAHEVQLLINLKKYQMEKSSRIIHTENYIFPNSLGRALDSSGDRKWFKKLCERAGVKKYQLYQMRKTAFTELSRVTDLPTVMAYSGHTQMSTLINHYINPSETAVRIALEQREKNRLRMNA